MIATSVPYGGASMSVKTKTLPDFSAQVGPAYAAATDRTAAVHDRLAGAFAPLRIPLQQDGWV